MTFPRAGRSRQAQVDPALELKRLLADHLNMDALISLPVLPPGWERGSGLTCRKAPGGADRDSLFLVTTSDTHRADCKLGAAGGQG
jgi:hypothetical protein